MKFPIALGLALALMPSLALAQDAPPLPPPEAGAMAAPTAAQQVAERQFRAQIEQNHLQTRANILAALTPQHRAAVASIVGQLALSATPNPRGAAQALDALLAPAEKQSVVTIWSAARTNARTLMQQHRAAMAATLTADERARMQEREAKMQAFMQSHSRPTRQADPGEIVLRTLANFGGPGGMHGHPF